METNKISGNSKYYIDYVYDNPTGPNFYHTLVRRSDNAILFANPHLDNMFLRCFHLGITHKDVVVL